MDALEEENQNKLRASPERPVTQLPPQTTQPLTLTPEASGPSRTHQDEFTTVSLQLQALEKQKETLANQLAT